MGLKGLWFCGGGAFAVVLLLKWWKSFSENRITLEITEDLFVDLRTFDAEAADEIICVVNGQVIVKTRLLQAYAVQVRLNNAHHTGSRASNSRGEGGSLGSTQIVDTIKVFNLDSGFVDPERFARENRLQFVPAPTGAHLLMSYEGEARLPYQLAVPLQISSCRLRPVAGERCVDFEIVCASGTPLRIYNFTCELALLGTDVTCTACVMQRGAATHPVTLIPATVDPYGEPSHPSEAACQFGGGEQPAVTVWRMTMPSTTSGPLTLRGRWVPGPNSDAVCEWGCQWKRIEAGHVVPFVRIRYSAERTASGLQLAKMTLTSLGGASSGPSPGLQQLKVHRTNFSLVGRWTLQQEHSPLL
jgi:hypothetical protein